MSICDDVLVFESLGKKEIAMILDEQIAELSSRLEDKNLSLRLSSSAKDYLVENGYEPSMGARPMRRLVQKEIEDEIANLIISGKCTDGDEIFVTMKNENLSVKVSSSKTKGKNVSSLSVLEQIDLSENQKITEDSSEAFVVHSISENR